MQFLLDTMVLAEPARPSPDPRALSWLGGQEAIECAISAITLGEIRKGVSLLRGGPRRVALERWLQHELPAQFRQRVLPVSAEVALAWGVLSAEAQRRGRPLPTLDGLLLATAQVHDLTLATRNTRHCADRGVPVINPWDT
jgi:predicted nucleic acid-binding protein